MLAQALDTTATDRRTRIAALGAAIFVFVLYLVTLAPGITWAHQGADGSELLVAAVTRGVPHPPGYPLYTMLLSAWLALVGVLAPLSELAWRGNLFSACCGALSVYVTVLVARALLDLAGNEGTLGQRRWLWASLAGLAWGCSPLLWSQSIITEVYALHALIVALLGWVLLASHRRWWLLVFPVALGTAHHITLFLLLPAVLWLIWAAERGLRGLLWGALRIAVGMLCGALFYLYIPLVGAAHPAPVNWGYVASWEEFRWLVSGEAYRAYLFATPTSSLVGRIAQWAYVLVVQYTPIGLLLALTGLAHLDQYRPALRTFVIVWIVPLSIYAIGYFTRDSEIYLLPVTWILGLCLAVGLQCCAKWLAERKSPTLQSSWLLPVVMLLLIGVNLGFFWRNTSLRNDRAARDFLAQVDAILPSNAIVVSRSDNETFAMWYGTWGNRMLAQNGTRPVIPVNDSLYQFAWYRRLQGDLYPELPGVDDSFSELIAWNFERYPIYYTEELPIPDGMRLEAEPPLWRLVDDGGANE